jgi:hypothetical protein
MIEIKNEEGFEYLSTIKNNSIDEYIVQKG